MISCSIVQSLELYFLCASALNSYLILSHFAFCLLISNLYKGVLYAIVA